MPESGRCRGSVKSVEWGMQVVACTFVNNTSALPINASVYNADEFLTMVL